MKYIFKIGLASITLVSLFTACKKYPEDHMFMEFKTPEKKLEGNWLLTKYTINDKDSTNALYNHYIGFNYSGTPTPGPQYGNLILEVSTSENKLHQHSIDIFCIGGTGTAKLINDKNYLEIDFTVTGYKYYPALITDTIPVYNLFMGNSIWNIRELTKTWLKINSTINHTSYSMEFTKQNNY